MPASISWHLWSLQPQEPAAAAPHRSTESCSSCTPARLLPKTTPPAEEEEEAEAELSWEVGSAYRCGNLFYLRSVEENWPKPWHFTTWGLTGGGIFSLGQSIIFLLVLACCFLASVKPNCCCMSPPPIAAFAWSWKWLCRKLVAPSPPADPHIFAPTALGDSDLVRLSALRCFSPLVIPSLVPAPGTREDLKHRRVREGTA